MLPQSRYFLNRLRHFLQRTKQFGPLTIDDRSREDLLLWKHLLLRASCKGNDINNITFTDPTTICLSDACEHGIGGYNKEGLVWRYEIPIEHRGKLSINLLEFIAAVITIELTLTNGGPKQKILSFTDSSSALGWLSKASFHTSMPHHDTTARHLAHILTDHDSNLYSQHIRGSHNFIADSLSRDHHIDTLTLTNAFHRLLPSQTPPNFHIIQPPQATTSWLLSLLHSATKPLEPLQQPTRSKLGVSIGGSDFWEQLGLATSGWTTSRSNKEHTSYEHLLPLVEEINAVKQQRSYLQRTPSRPPSHMFVRPFGQVFGPILPSTPMINPPSSCQGS